MDASCRRVRSGLGDRAACSIHSVLWPCQVRALSLTRPWSELVVSGLKTVENRSWSTPIRGWVLIHAAKSWDDAAISLVNELVGDGLFASEDYATLDGCALHRDAPTGYLGVARITDCHHAGDLFCLSRRTPTSPDELCSEWAFDGSCHWAVADAVRFPEPVPGGGALGIFVPPADVLGRLRDLMWEAGCHD